MTTATVKRTATAALAIATMAAGLTFSTVGTANAGKHDFWRGVGAGFVTGVVVNEIGRSHRHRHSTHRHSSWDAHVAWCYDRYRSYSHRDDRYTTNSGYRRRCNSPYL